MVMTMVMISDSHTSSFNPTPCPSYEHAHIPCACPAVWVDVIIVEGNVLQAQLVLVARLAGQEPRLVRLHSLRQSRDAQR